MFVAYFYYLQNLETFHSAKFFCRSISFAQMRGFKRVLDDPLKKPCCGQKWVLATLIKTIRAAKNEYWWPFSLTFWPLFFSKWVLKTLTWPNLSTLALWDHTLRYHNACICHSYSSNPIAHYAWQFLTWQQSCSQWEVCCACESNEGNREVNVEVIRDYGYNIHMSHHLSKEDKTSLVTNQIQSFYVFQNCQLPTNNNAKHSICRKMHT